MGPSLDEALQRNEGEEALPGQPTPRGRALLKQTFTSIAAVSHIIRKSRYTMPFGDLSMTVLMHACATGNSERVRQCLESLQGESADQTEALELELTATDDWAGSSPLHWAAFSGNARVVEMLLKVGAKVNAHNQRDGSLPIHLAARYGKSAALVALADDRGRLCEHPQPSRQHPAARVCVRGPRRRGWPPAQSRRQARNRQSSREGRAHSLTRCYRVWPSGGGAGSASTGRGHARCAAGHERDQAALQPAAQLQPLHAHSQALPHRYIRCPPDAPIHDADEHSTAHPGRLRA